MNFCPLCGEPVLDKDSAYSEILQVSRSRVNREPQTQFQKLTAFQQRKLVWEIIGIILVSGGLITLIIDLISHSAMTWSKYPAMICLVLFINATLTAFWNRRIILLLSASFIVSALLLIFIDLDAGIREWWGYAAVPWLFAAYLVLYGFIVLIGRLRQYGLNMIALILVTGGVLSICLDGIISLYVRHSFHLGWSVIVMVSILPVAAFLLLVHFRLKRGTDLKRFFHI